MEFANLSTLLQGATLAAVLWLFRTAQQLREDHAVLRTILTGERGDNGVNGEVKALRATSKAHAEQIHFHSGKFDLVDLRLEVLEDRRHGPDDRRVSA